MPSRRLDTVPSGASPTPRTVHPEPLRSWWIRLALAMAGGCGVVYVMTRMAGDGAPGMVGAMAAVGVTAVLSVALGWREERTHGPPQPVPDERSRGEIERLTVENRVLGYERGRLLRVFDELPSGFVATDPMGEIILINQVGASILDAAPESAVGQPLRQMAPGLNAIAAEAERTGRAVLTRGTPPDERHYAVRRRPLPGPAETHAGTLYTLRDVTQQRSAERTQVEFLSQISHELKAPLNTIVTYIDALTDPELLDENERRDYFNNLTGEAQRMARLISNLLQISRIELGNLSARFGFVKPAAMIKEVTTTFQAQAEGRGLSLAIHVPDNLPPLFGDKDLLGVAVTNLLSNAVKYTPSGGRVVVRADTDGAGISILVEDSGIGIPEDVRGSIFDRFARSHQTEVQSQTGSGLGLALVREIVHLHDGTVQIESEVGQGSRFRVWLPVREAGDRLQLAAA